MMHVEIATAPFALMEHVYTRIAADGDANWFDGRNNRLYSHVVCMPMTHWLLPYRERLSVWPGFLSAISREANERAFHFHFFGNQEAYEVFRRETAFQREQLDREQLEVEFSYAGKPDAGMLASQMRKLLLTMQDEMIFSRQDNKTANLLRHQLRMPQPKLETVRDDEAVLIQRIHASEEEIADTALCLVFDSSRMGPLQIETEYLKQLEAHGQKNLHSLRCLVLHENAQMAVQAAARLQESLRYKNICAWPIYSATSQEEARRIVIAYMENGYEEAVYLPAVLERCTELIRQYAGQEDFENTVMEDWKLFCGLLLPREDTGKETYHGR